MYDCSRRGYYYKVNISGCIILGQLSFITFASNDFFIGNTIIAVIILDIMILITVNSDSPSCSSLAV